MTKQQVHEIRFGLIRVKIWRQQSRSGEWHHVTVAREYRDGESIRESTLFGRNDLLALAKAVDLAHTWIFQQGNATKGDLS
jgi:hypothetical protein